MTPNFGKAPYELLSKFPHTVIGRGLTSEKTTRDFTKLQWEPTSTAQVPLRRLILTITIAHVRGTDIVVHTQVSEGSRPADKP